MEATSDWYSQELSKVMSFLHASEDNRNQTAVASVYNDFQEQKNPSFAAREKTQHKRDEEEKKISSKHAHKICAKCGTSETPLWRRGENKSILCNKCGLLYRRICKKGTEVKKTKSKQANSTLCAPQMVVDSSEDEQPHLNEDILAVASEVIQQIHNSHPHSVEMANFSVQSADDSAQEIQKWLETTSKSQQQLL